MINKKMLPKLELFIIVIFLGSFIIWAVSKCSSTREAIQEKVATEAPVAGETAETETDQPKGEQAEADARTEDKTPRTSTERVTTLYVTIDGLNLRSEPTLDSEVILKLDLFEEVYFMNEVTDFTEEISLGKTTVNEPWIKVRHRKGRVGWVYGAGVHYYKMKHPGVE